MHNCGVSLRGGNFINRYRLDGILTTKSPLHIGSGSTTNRPGCEKPKDDGTGNERIEISAVIADYLNKPFLPGSAIRGNLRHWLLQIFKSMTCSSHVIASDREIKVLEDDAKKWAKSKELDGLTEQGKQIAYMKEEASLLERVFGTTLAAGKVDFQDAYCLQGNSSINSSALPPSDQAPFWRSDRLTYVAQSIAIDPKTQTAMDKRLYHFELVPKGVEFKFTITGKNLTDQELGLIFFALEGFNSIIFPVTLGSMISRGYGQLDFKLEKIYSLKSDDRVEWVKAILSDNRAGFESLTMIPDDKKQKIISDSKDAFLKLLEVGI